MFEFLFGRGSKHNGHMFLILIGILFITGTLYGIFISPVWNEMAEFGQQLAGQVAYSEINSFYVNRSKELSTQSILPAMLFRAGLSSYYVSITTSALTCAVAFTAWGLVAFI